METQVWQRFIQSNKEAACWKHVRLSPQSSHGITNDMYDEQLPLSVSISVLDRRQSQNSPTSLMSRKLCMCGGPLRAEKQHWLDYWSNIMRLRRGTQSLLTHGASLVDTLQKDTSLTIAPGASSTECYRQDLVQIWIIWLRELSSLSTRPKDPMRTPSSGIQ